ncbi:hypothetical protein [Qipengyuania sp. 902]|uniref:hypothetical protein n=1 Tax=Qipengyuania sp. 902 TaxID=3417565 RepID=UPI003EBA7FD5
MQDEFDYGQNDANGVNGKPAASNGGELAEAETHAGSIQSIARDVGANYVLARDIQLDAALHERRAFSDDDLAHAKAVVAHEHLVAPFPVVERGNELILLDGFVTLQALIARDPDAMVKVVRFDEKDALAIRLADTRHRRKREPMGPARQALARHREGVAQDAIARELCVSAGNVSQMISAAEAEEEFEGLADLLVDRSKIPRSFWFDLYTTLERLKKVDATDADGSSPNADRFRKLVEDLIAADKPISADDLRAKLGINAKRGQPKRRNRVLGTPVRRPGLKTKICVDRKRQGGPVINFEPGYPAKDFDAALEALLTFLTNPDAASPPRI